MRGQALLDGLGDLVVRLEILRSADRVPICSATSWLPAARAADAARIYRTRRSMTATLMAPADTSCPQRLAARGAAADDPDAVPPAFGGSASNDTLWKPAEVTRLITSSTRP